MPSFVLANGDICKPLGWTVLPLHVGLVTPWVQRAYIMPEGEFDMILGCDFFGATGTVFNFREGMQHVQIGTKGTRIPFTVKHEATTFRGACSPLVTQETLLLEPRKRYMVNLSFLEDDPNRSAVCLNGLVNKLSRGTDARHSLANSVSKYTSSYDKKRGQVLCQISNFSGQPAVLRPGSILGYFRPVFFVDSKEAEALTHPGDCLYDPVLLDSADGQLLKKQLHPFTQSLASAAPHSHPLGPAAGQVSDGWHSDHIEQPGKAPPSDEKLDLDEDVEGEEDCPILTSGPYKGLPADLVKPLEKAKQDFPLNQTQFERLKQLLIQYSDVFARSHRKVDLSTMRPMRIDLMKDSKPYQAPLRRYSPAERTLIREYCQDLLDGGVLEPSTSPWRANVIMVPKPDGSYRCTLDFRVLNSMTEVQSSNLPSLADNLDALGGKRVFSALDITQAYFTCDLYEPHREYTAFFCPGIGSLQFKRCAMGLVNSQAHFVQLTLDMFSDLLFDCVAVYADDVFIFSDSVEEHFKHLEQVLQRFREHHVHIKAKKCELFTKSVTWCGYEISQEGLLPDPRKVKAVEDMPTPTNLKELRSFLGLCNFLRRWVHRFADLTAPLRPLLKKGAYRSDYKS